MSDQNHKHMSLGDWLITFLILIIPIVGIVMLFVWAFSSTTNRSKSNWAKANLIFSVVPFLIFMVFMFISLSFVSYRGHVDKGYASEVQLLLKEVAGASEMYEARHGGQQTTVDELESKAFIDLSYKLKSKWKVEISGDIFVATSTDYMDAGAGHEVRYDRATGEFSGYGFEGY